MNKNKIVLVTTVLGLLGFVSQAVADEPPVKSLPHRTSGLDSQGQRGRLLPEATVDRPCPDQYPYYLPPEQGSKFLFCWGKNPDNVQPTNEKERNAARDKYIREVIIPHLKDTPPSKDKDVASKATSDDGKIQEGLAKMGKENFIAPPSKTPQDIATTNASLQVLMQWTTKLSDYDAPKVLPKVKIVNQRKMAEIADCACQVIGFYDNKGTIWLTDTPYGLDTIEHVLVHEMTHYLQDMSGNFKDKKDCKTTIDREREAYKVQNKFITIAQTQDSSWNKFPDMKCVGEDPQLTLH